MRHILRRWLNQYFSNPQVIILIFLLLVVFFLILAFGKMIMPVFVAIMIAFLLDGIIEGLKRFHG